MLGRLIKKSALTSNYGCLQLQLYKVIARVFVTIAITICVEPWGIISPFVYIWFSSSFPSFVCQAKTVITAHNNYSVFFQIYYWLFHDQGLHNNTGPLSDLQHTRCLANVNAWPDNRLNTCRIIAVVRQGREINIYTICAACSQSHDNIFKGLHAYMHPLDAMWGQGALPLYLKYGQERKKVVPVFQFSFSFFSARDRPLLPSIHWWQRSASRRAKWKW